MSYEEDRKKRRKQEEEDEEQRRRSNDILNPLNPFPFSPTFDIPDFGSSVSTPDFGGFDGGSSGGGGGGADF